ncbi:MAG TPA: dephospho-CoA kinase [Solirubrobacterales bacterium]|nr:dephospho-CoA kinase [Solirubrobacterales bacterium]
MTRFIGLTGGIGAGKSEALAAAGRLGAATLSTDQVTHQLLGREDVTLALAERWGDEIAPGGEIDRAKVAAIVFAEPDELAWLESQLHPLVGEQVLAWRESLDPGVEVAVIEVPLLFEAGLEEAFDATLAVIADDPLRERRLAERGQAGLVGREGRQLPQEEKAARANHVIRNDGTLEELERELSRALEGVRRDGASA